MSRTPEAFGEDQSKFKADKPLPHPVNPLGQWVEDFRAPRGWSDREISEKFNLPSLRLFKNKPPEETSLYVIEQVLEQAVINGATETEQSLLRDAVEKIILITLEKKGELYDRIPPSVPRRISDQLPCVTYTDSRLARNIDPRVMKRKIPRRVSIVREIRTDFGFPIVVTEEQAQKIKDEIAARDRRRAEKSMIKNEFALNVSKITGKDPAVFKDCPWITNRRQLPNPEEFGAILESNSMTKKQREKIINYWLDKYRETINLEMLGREYGLTRARMHQIKKLLGYKGNSLSWKVVEKIREYKRRSEEGLIRVGRPVSEGTMFSLAKEFGVSASSVGQYVDRLDIKNRRKLTPLDIEKIRDYRRELLEMGGTHKTKGSIAKLALEMGTTRTSIHRSAAALGINPKNPSEEDLERIRQYRNTLHT